MKMKGFDDLKKQLKKMERGAKELSQKKDVSFNELFPSSFMRKYTQCASIDEFLDNCGFPASTNAELEAIPDEAMDIYTRQVTRFRSWQEMLDTATEQLVSKKLGL